MVYDEGKAIATRYCARKRAVRGKVKNLVNNVAPLQIRDEKGSENRIISKHILLRAAQYKDFIGGRSIHNTIIEHFGVSTT